MTRGEVVGGAVGVLVGVAALVFVAALAFGWLADTPAVKVPGQTGYAACSTTAFDPAGIGPTCHR